MRKKEAKRPQTQGDPKTIADLKDAIEALVSGRKQLEELGGTIDDARALAQEWKIKESRGYEQSLFDSTTNNRTFLLAALVVELSRDHELIELIRRYHRKELDELARASSKAALAELSACASVQGQFNAKQRSELKRRRRNRGNRESIEYQFGGGLETDIVKAGLLPISSGSFYEFVILSGQDCLDDIFAGCPVSMQRLEDLFDMDRHRLSDLLQGDRKGDYRDVVKIMDALLIKENPREKRKSSKRGRPPPEPWLNGFNLRSRVLKGIESRIKSVVSEPWKINPAKVRDWKKEIADAFLGVVRDHLKSPPEKNKVYIYGAPSYQLRVRK